MFTQLKDILMDSMDPLGYFEVFPLQRNFLKAPPPRFRTIVHLNNLVFANKQ